MTNADKKLDELLKGAAHEPPKDFAAKIMLAVGDIEQLPASEDGIDLHVGVSNNRAAEQDYSLSLSESLRIRFSTHPVVEKIAEVFRWTAVAVGGALGVEQAAAFIAGAWTVTAAF